MKICHTNLNKQKENKKAVENNNIFVLFYIAKTNIFFKAAVIFCDFLT